MRDQTDPFPSNTVRLRVSSQTVARIDALVEAGRAPTRQSVVDWAISVFFDGSPQTLAEEIRQLRKLQAFSIYLGAGALKEQLDQADQLNTRAMANALVEEGIDDPLYILNALGFADSSDGSGS
tara:strand:+ start:41957 stop:42328 length:372 start_codon:yes stop_codon:yes gene_type:complete